ncbi:MAG: VOC family protein [Anaerolineae bacterium]|nr:VOC family protein [Anaerolineae bacterium]
MNPKLDHVVIAVQDLDQAIYDYRDLGFNVLRGSVHSDGATQNAIIPFEDDTYLELLAPTGVTPMHCLMDWSTLLQNGEGLVGYALRTENIEAEASRLTNSGLSVGKVVECERRRADGVLVQWKVLQVENGFAPFFIQDVTSYELRVPNDVASTTHPNHTVGIALLLTVARSIKDSFERYQKILGLTSYQNLNRSLDLNTAGLRFIEAKPHSPSPRTYWEAYLRENYFEYADAIQIVDPSHDSPTFARTREWGQRELATLMASDQREADYWTALAYGAKSEALFSVHIIVDNTPEPDDRYPLHKTHGVHLYEITGVSKRRKLPVFEKMDRIDWSQISAAYGPAINIPGLIRALASEYEAVRDDAYEALRNHINHQGSVYEATLTALPLLIELLSVSEFPDKTSLLYTIMQCGGNDPHEITPSSDQATSFDLEKALRRTFLTGTSIYLQLLDAPDPSVRSAAAKTLSICNYEVDTIQSALITHRMSEVDPVARAKITESLIHYWLLSVGQSSILTPQQQAFLAAWMQDPNEPPAVHFRTAINLLMFGEEVWHQDAIAILNRVMENDAVTLGTLASEYSVLMFEIQQALEKYPELHLKWLIAQARHPVEEFRAEIPWQLRKMAELRRSFTQTAVPVLISLTQDVSVEVRYNAVSYLVDAPNANVEEVLQKVATSDPSPPIREQASEQLQRFAEENLHVTSIAPDYSGLDLSLDQMLTWLEVAKDYLPYNPSLISTLGKYGMAASSAVPTLKYILVKPDRTGWIKLETLKALWHIQPSAAKVMLPELLPQIAFLPATVTLFKLFGEMGSYAESALPFLKQFVASDLRGDGLQGMAFAGSKIYLDEALKATAQVSIEQIEQSLTH